jgi:DNA-binding NtrC family response regulator
MSEPKDKMGKSMLIVDDDEGILKVINRIFSKRGYSVDTAETGEEAKTKIKTRTYDVALIDLRLPDMYGTDLLQTINDAAPKTVKIILTGLADVTNTFESQEGGADAFLQKPVAPTLLIETIEKKLNERKQL